jgi:E3 ubiquitin-protein ligase HUWE1
MEQARQQQQSIDPSQPADAVSFLTSLTPDLRRTILSDMDDTLISQLPEDIATEAQTLRQQRENHRLQYMALQHARYENMAARLVPTWSGSNNMVTGPSHYRYAVFSPSEHRLTGFLPPYARVVYADNESKKMLDQEAMTCLLVLLFLDQNKLHFNRLFRIFRSLSQHADSRSWLISSLLSILCQANFSLPPSAHTCPTTVHSTSTPHHSKSSQPHWLTISINAALGSHANVFQFATAGKSPPSVYIHPHASVSICNNILELLIFLARQFPSSFLPSQLLPKDDKNPPSKNSTNNFWQILYHLDTVSGSRKGKSTSKTLHCPAPDVLVDANGDIFGGSPIGQLMSLFSHSTIQSSVSLVDKLLRVLSVISGAIPKQSQSGAAESGSEATPTPTPTAVKKTDNLFISEVVIPTCFNKSVVPVSLLQNSINLLTSGKCSEDTLDDATSLLINLSRCGMETRETILLILMEGLKSIGRTLQGQIAVLLNEIISNSSLLAQNHLVNDKESVKSTTSGAGLGTVTGVVLPTARGARTTVDHSNDLHLPCMEPLVCKGSQQSFFLRLLKVVCQLRESAIITSHSSTTETPEVPPTSSSSVPTSSAAPNPSTDTTNQPTSSKSTQSKSFDLPPLSLQLELEELWSITSECLDALAATYDPHAVLALQQTVEAFFLVHAEQHDVSDKRNQRPSSLSRRVPHLSDATPDSPSFNDILSPVPLTPLHSESELVIDPYSHLPPDTARFLKFAERHRTVLNQILRQTIVPLSEGPFAVLVNHTRLLDFDVKRRYFRQELEQMDEGLRREDLVIHVRRNHVFEDSYRELYRRSSEEMKANLYVTFEGEEGQDAGGLLREWYLIIAREMFNPNYALFKTTPGDRVTYMPNPSSHINPEHLNYFKFVGRIIAKAIYDNKLLDCYFTRSFYKHILGKPVHYTDMESEDYAFYQGMVYLLEHNMDEMGIELTFSAEVNHCYTFIFITAITMMDVFP